MSHGRLSLTAIAVGAAFASSAGAQVTADAMTQGRQARSVDLELRAGVEHNTNVARTSASLAAARGISQSDTMFLPSANANIVLPVGQQVVFLNGSASYIFHDKNSQLDHSRFDVNGGVGGRLGPCGATATAGYSRGRSELQDYTLVDTVYNILEVKRLGLSMNCVRAPGIGVYGSVSKSWGSNSATLTTNGDYVTTSAQGGLRYVRAATGSIGLIGTYARTEYNDRPLATFVDRGYEMRGGGVELERRLGGRIQANASVTYVHVEPLSVVPGATKDFNGLNYSGDVTYRASSRLSGNLNFGRNVSPTLIQGQSYELQTIYGAGLDYRIGSRISLGLDVQRRKNDAQGGIVTPAGFLRDSRTNIYRTSLSYRMNERISFDLSAGREERRADNPNFNYNSNRFGVSAGYSF